MRNREAIDSGPPSQSDAALARAALEQLPDAVLVCDVSGRVRFANRAAVDLLGPSAVSGAAVLEALSEAPLLAQMVLDACGTGTPRSACEVPRPAGTTRRLLARVVPLEPELSCLLTARPVTDDGGGDRDLWQAEKMAALGRLAASVAHEVRNPLGAVDIQLQLLAEDARSLEGSLSQRLLERVDRARTEMRRLDGIVQNFLRFSRPPTVHLEATDPRPLVQRLRDLVAPEARSRGIRFDCPEPPPLPHVLADENVLSQAILNVLINAFQAVVRDSDESCVELACRHDEGRERVVIEVRDNGCGIPAEDLDRVLEYYYTTKDTGTGLGLSIAQGILQQHGGSLHLTSRVGQGTTVSLSLPECSPNGPWRESRSTPDPGDRTA